jgi:hypothetical protein
MHVPTGGMCWKIKSLLFGRERHSQWHADARWGSNLWIFFATYVQLVLDMKTTHFVQDATTKKE